MAKETQKTKSGMFGSGLLQTAVDKSKKRARRNCEASGGVFDPKTGRCKL